VLLSQEIWLPPVEWQQKIKVVSNALYSMKTDQDIVSGELDALLPSILDKAFKGELV